MPDQEQRLETHTDAIPVSQAHPSEVGTEWSTWRPLHLPMFRNLLGADLVSDAGTFMQGVGAAWLMVSQGAGPLLVALTQTASAFPFFLLALPAGALGDIFDRRKLILTTELWMMFSVAVVLAVLTVLHLNYALGAALFNTRFVDRRCARSADLASGPSRSGAARRIDAGHCSKRH
jgi:MFS family permease